jgi:hypothetical protein
MRVAWHEVPGSLARSAWENKKERTVPKGTIDPVVPSGLPAPVKGIAGNALILFSRWGWLLN